MRDVRLLFFFDEVFFAARSLLLTSIFSGTSTAAFLSIHNMCGWMLDTFGSDELKSTYLEKMTTAEYFASYCLTEPTSYVFFFFFFARGWDHSVSHTHARSGSDASSLKTTAVEDGDSYVINGSKAFISGGSQSDLYFVMCRTDPSNPSPKGISCVLIDATKLTEKDGLSFGGQEQKMGWNSQPTCEVRFDNVRVPKSALVGKEGGGFSIAMRGLDGGRLSIASCSIGAARASFDLARRHVRDRVQFGKPLAAQQNVQFQLAKMSTAIHSSRLLVRAAAELLDAKDPRATAFCAMAKKDATEKCFQVCDDAVQLFGGYGYMKRSGVERFFRDARVHRILEGTNEIMDLVHSRAILKDE